MIGSLLAEQGDRRCSTVLVRPPYIEAHQFMRTILIDKGCLLVIHVPPHRRQHLASIVRGLGPSIGSVVLWSNTGEEIARFGSTLLHLGPGRIDAVADTQSTETSLRRQLTDQTTTRRTIPFWLQTRGVMGNSSVLSVVRAILRSAMACSRSSDLLRAHGLNPRTVARHFEQAACGTPAGWFYMLRSLMRAILIQRYPAMSLSSIADRVGCFDASALRREMRDVIGANPTQIRQLLGWKWMLAAALRRSGHSSTGGTLATTSVRLGT